MHMEKRMGVIQGQAARMQSGDSQDPAEAKPGGDVRGWCGVEETGH
jgi:hypothetical protein